MQWRSQKQAPPAEAAARLPGHGFGDIECQALCARIAPRQRARDIAGTATGIEHDGRPQLHDIETIEQPLGDGALQDRDFVIGLGGALEGRAQAPLVERRPNSPCRVRHEETP